MTLALYKDDEYVAEVGTNSGWSTFRHMAEKLDAKTYPAVMHLALYGWCQQLKLLTTQLTALAKEVDDKDISNTISDLIESIGNSKKNSYVIVTDGVGVKE